MPVIIAGRSGATWGLNELSGMIAQAGESEASIEENPSPNADGEIEMTSFYNPTRSIEMSGIYTGISQSLGATMAVSILIIGQPDGEIYCKNIRLSQAGESFASIHLRGIQYNLF